MSKYIAIFMSINVLCCISKEAKFKKDRALCLLEQGKSPAYQNNQGIYQLKFDPDLSDNFLEVSFLFDKSKLSQIKTKADFIECRDSFVKGEAKKDGYYMVRCPKKHYLVERYNVRGESFIGCCEIVFGDNDEIKIVPTYSKSACCASATRLAAEVKLYDGVLKELDKFRQSFCKSLQDYQNRKPIKEQDFLKAFQYPGDTLDCYIGVSKNRSRLTLQDDYTIKALELDRLGIQSVDVNSASFYAFSVNPELTSKPVGFKSFTKLDLIDKELPTCGKICLLFANDKCQPIELAKNVDFFAINEDQKLYYLRMLDPSKGFVLSNFDYSDIKASQKSAEEFMAYLDQRLDDALADKFSQFPEYDTADALAKAKTALRSSLDGEVDVELTHKEYKIPINVRLTLADDTPEVIKLEMSRRSLAIKELLEIWKQHHPNIYINRGPLQVRAKSIIGTSLGSVVTSINRNNCEVKFSVYSGKDLVKSFHYKPLD